MALSHVEEKRRAKVTRREYVDVGLPIGCQTLGSLLQQAECQSICAAKLRHRELLPSSSSE